MNKVFMLMMLCLTVSLSGMGGEANAGIGNVAARSVAKRVAGYGAAAHAERKSAQELGTLARRDMERDGRLKTVTLERDIHVNRYTSNAQAKSEAKYGVKANRHFTSVATSGRPLTPDHAARRYSPTSGNGAPTIRQTWRLSKGTMVKKGKVLEGEPGYGEIVPQTRISPQNLISTTPLD